MLHPFSYRCSRGSGRLSVSNSRPDSIDLGLLCSRSLADLPSIASECLTLNSLSSGYSDTVPSFGGGRPISDVTIVGLGDNLQMFSNRNHGRGTKDQRRSALLAAPTSPRLKTMLTESLCVGKWVDSLPNIGAPGHLPWGGFEERSPVVWIPEGSIHPPEFYTDYLLTTRSEGLPCRRTSYCFGRGYSKPDANKRPNYGPTESTDDMPNGLTRGSLSTKNSSILPSDSCSNFPLPSEPLVDVDLAAASNLAVRRGKKPLPSLACNKQVTWMPSSTSYPDIPTPFLGSPSKYSLKFDSASRAKRKSIAVQDMIDRLRVQCTALNLRTPQDYDSWDATASQIPEFSCPATPRQPNSTSDEWAFADSLDSDFGSRLSVLYPIAVNRKTTATKGDDGHSPTSLAGARASFHGEAYRRESEAKSAISNQTECGAQPEPAVKCKAPRPLQSVMKKTLPTKSKTRKSLKCVRFATYPDSPKTIYIPPSFSDSGSDPTEDRQSLSLTKASQHESKPEEKNLARALYKRPTLDGGRDKPRPTRKGPMKVPSFLLAQSFRKPKASISGSSLRRSMVPSNIPGTPYERPSTASDIPSPPVPRLARHSFMKHSFGRRSLSRIIKLSPQEKENKRMTGLSISSANSQWSINENTARRNSTYKAGQQKSRVPLPLRSIFTRFG